jgi:hypothetical protein
VDVSTALAADLRCLLHVLGLSDLDLETSLRALRTDVSLVVPSFIGLVLTLEVDGQNVTLTSIDDVGTTNTIASSLRLPVTLTAAPSPGAEIVLYATAPGAFVDLAADLSYAPSAKEDELRLDDDLTPATLGSGLRGVTELALINRAIGLLIGRGHTPEEARAHLEGRAAQSRLKVFQVAAHLISALE